MVKAGVDSAEVTGNVSYTDVTCDKYCIKVEVTLGSKFKDNPNYLQSVARTCGSQCIDHCYPITNPSTYVQQEVCVNCCETDLCNGAGAVNFNLLAYVVLSSIVFCVREMS
ncbi:uncharacterized protein [Asterias amurensis]|uniref:uncharacterized protein n=1 Tax=Asterias amurensis TaxID=7602 RepID=UPI003AB887F1